MYKNGTGAAILQKNLEGQNNVLAPEVRMFFPSRNQGSRELIRLNSSLGFSSLLWLEDQIMN